MDSSKSTAPSVENGQVCRWNILRMVRNFHGIFLQWKLQTGRFKIHCRGFFRGEGRCTATQLAYKLRHKLKDCPKVVGLYAETYMAPHLAYLQFFSFFSYDFFPDILKGWGWYRASALYRRLSVHTIVLYRTTYTYRDRAWKIMLSGLLAAWILKWVPPILIWCPWKWLCKQRSRYDI
jgi:hypothetical protein